MEGDGRLCNTCSNRVSPVRELGENKCPVCGSEFTEAVMENNEEGNDLFRSASVFSLYAPILLGLMSALTPALAAINNNNSSSSIREEEEDEQEITEQHGDLTVRRRIQRRRSSSTSLMLILHRLHTESDRNSNDTENDRRNNSIVNLNVVVIDPFNEEALILRSPSQMSNAGGNNPPMGSVGDFLDGPGFGLLLQQLAQSSNNEINRYVNSVNPPAQKAAIEAMPTVVMTEESVKCIICLDEAEIGSEVKAMPCGHKFHSDCIVSWLKLRSSCPVCRFQMPADDDSNKVEVNGGRRNEGYPASSDQMVGRDRDRDRERRMSFGRWNWLSILQPFDYFLPSP